MTCTSTPPAGQVVDLQLVERSVSVVLDGRSVGAVRGRCGVRGGAVGGGDPPVPGGPVAVGPPGRGVQRVCRPGPFGGRLVGHVERHAPRPKPPGRWRPPGGWMGARRRRPRSKPARSPKMKPTRCRVRPRPTRTANSACWTGPRPATTCAKPASAADKARRAARSAEDEAARQRRLHARPVVCASGRAPTATSRSTAGSPPPRSPA